MPATEHAVPLQAPLHRHGYLEVLPVLIAVRFSYSNLSVHREPPMAARPPEEVAVEPAGSDQLRATKFAKNDYGSYLLWLAG